MKILHVIANVAARYGGPSKACLEMAAATAARGHDVSVFTTNQDGSGVLDVPLDAPVMHDGVKVNYYPVHFPRFFVTSMPMASALKNRLKEFDLVHVHSLYVFHGLVAGHYCRKYRIPYIVRPHGTLDPYIHSRKRPKKAIAEVLFENRNLRHASTIHFTAADEMTLAAPYIQGNQGMVVPLGINTGEYENLPEKGLFRKQYPQTEGKRILLFLSRINFKKGLDLLVKAFAQIMKERDDVHLVIAGPDNEGFGENVRSWIAEEGIGENITFTGMVLGDDKLSLFRDADIFILPSYSENFGISVVEAMACGLPVIISNKVNIWREVQAGGAGFVVDCNAKDLAGAISDAVANPDATAAMGQNARKFAALQFDWTQVAAKLESAYEDVLQSSKRSDSHL